MKRTKPSHKGKATQAKELRFPEGVKEVRIRKQGDSILLSPVKPDWASFFAMQVDVPEDFLADRNDTLPQSRTPL